MEFDEGAFLKRRGVTLYLDVGASRGQSGQFVRRAGYAGRICSFEPIPESFGKLSAIAATDPLWEVVNCAIGEREGKADIGISAHVGASSLREATDTLIAIYEPIRFIAHASVDIHRLDGLFDRFARPDDVVHLKVDTQGYERNVIEGAAGVLDRIDSMRLEVAVSEVYAGEMVLPEAISMMTERGFLLIDAWPAWRHPDTDEVLHFDLLFRRGTLA
ncbi:FkbM family methyltransferase [Ancylobacter sp. G4_0304]|uniref:FkbM family methyltransferase n=1 Tax=Ancylobacter sp. G4_0304 TaxID=3114289 RepID=UPI0039C6AB5F